MATRSNLVALLRLLSEEATEGVRAAPDAELRWLDVLVRNCESDLERVRQGLDELLQSEALSDIGDKFQERLASKVQWQLSKATPSVPAESA